ncbi:TPA: AAA family ATPase [Vibrio parahaemolyticus]|nr:AAA family ATPase [Vibrio parahaemolyticus]
MKINYFSINNFRGISGGLEQNKIVFEDTNTLFLYGQNNVGKSTFLKAYQHFYKEEKPTKVDFFKSDFTNQIEFEIEVRLLPIDRIKIEAAAPKQKESYKKYVKDDCLRIRKTWYLDGKAVKPLNQTYNYETKEFENIGYASIGLHSVFQSCLPKPVFIKAMPTEDEAKEILNEILKGMAENTLKEADLVALEEAKSKIKELQDKMYNPELIESYQTSVNSYFSQIFGDTLLKISESKDRLVWTENKLGKEFSVEFAKLGIEGDIDSSIPATADKVGHGTIRTAIFTLLLMKDVAEKFEREPGRKDYMVLFEEPELFLYPRIIKELRELIYKVSEDDLPYQVLCASHSPSMIDISKPKSSIIRLVKSDSGTNIYQINNQFLKAAKEVMTDEQLKQEMNEVLRFNPHVCEAFYADEVLLIEGPTEEVLARAYLQEFPTKKDFFILNCGTVNNIPFYQKILSKFKIKYHAIFDTDSRTPSSYDTEGNPAFDSHIQGSISKQFFEDKKQYATGLIRIHDTTFEPAHQIASIPPGLRFTESSPSAGKPYNANLYWKNVLYPNKDHPEFKSVPFISYIKAMLAH